MEQIDYKEKYEQAMERARQFSEKPYLEDSAGIVEYIFPELAESEGERIREELIETIHLAYDCGCSLNKEQRDKYLDWLEKQGTNISLFPKEQQVFMQKYVSLDKVTLIKLLAERDVNNTEIIESFEKQGEQKPDTDFSDLRTWKYIVDAVWTEKEGIGQYLDSPFTEEVAKKLQKRFGNIGQKPAVDTKVIIPKKHDVCDTCDEKDSCISPCCVKLVEEQGEQNTNLPSFEAQGTPIVKQDEQKPVDESSAFKNKLLELFQKFRYIKEGVPTNGDIIDYVDAHIQELIDTVQNNPWSEEDENTISEAEVWLDTLCDYLKDSSSAYIPNVRVVISNLKSLKDRVQPQPRQEWNEWNRILQDASISYLCNLRDEFETKGWDREQIQKCINWLKSLRPRNSWKPSNQQMLAVCTAIGIVGKYTYTGLYLQEVLEQVKKLMEE